MKTTNIMNVAVDRVVQHKIVAKMTTMQLNCFVILQNLVKGQCSDEEPAMTYELVKKEHRENPDDLYWWLLDIILESPLFPIPEDWNDYIVERTEDLDYVIYQILHQ